MSLEFADSTRSSLITTMVHVMVRELTEVLDERLPWTRRRALLEKWVMLLNGSGVVSEADLQDLGWRPGEPLDPERLRVVATRLIRLIGSRLFSVRGI